MAQKRNVLIFSCSIFQFWVCQTHTHNRFTAPLSGTTRVSRYQKKDSPIHTFPAHQPSFISFFHLPHQRFVKGFTKYADNFSPRMEKFCKYMYRFLWVRSFCDVYAVYANKKRRHCSTNCDMRLLSMWSVSVDDLIKRLNEWKDNVENRGMSKYE